ncbi:Putrescine transport system permease protein PotH [Paramagnetospirillum magnetotacticum MS-1]|uniref:Putrescine transport system permease protein PotH n=1 Tax=Paramagnetospirillum magnetotacticum MS-1 TaxID=272627 RepID=A0A0C2YWI7_PARME|nr:ABC transporter permease subunit [Paramagnetospirillum magnetotacticum]KIL99060.1 Putrescine transport system permease protein PotH [Paramagnetospirillum magnetotacticum MS-1]
MKGLLEGRGGRFLVGLAPYAWLLLFFLVPFLIVLKISLSEPQMGIPPYMPLWVEGVFRGTLAGYNTLLGDDLYLLAYLGSLKLAGISTLGCLLLGYPAAYAIARAPASRRQALLMLVALPFWTSFLIRVYAWIGILKNEGLLNMALMGMGVISEPLQILETSTAVVIGMVYSYLPFMILPLYATLEKMDLSLLEAAADLGCRPFKAFLAITLPLSMPGIIAGCMLVFIPAVGEFVIPDLLGGPDTLVIGKVLWAEFFDNRDWPTASAVAVAMLVLLVVPIMVFQHFEAKRLEREG